MLREDEALVRIADPGTMDPGDRAAFIQVFRDLEGAGVPTTKQFRTRDGLNAASLLAQFVVPAATIVVPTVGTVLGTWISGRLGRKVRVQIGETTIEAGSVAEVAVLMRHVQAHQAAQADREGRRRDQS